METKEIIKQLQQLMRRDIRAFPQPILGEVLQAAADRLEELEQEVERLDALAWDLAD